jgi:hypothetical protein
MAVLVRLPWPFFLEAAYGALANELRELRCRGSERPDRVLCRGLEAIVSGLLVGSVGGCCGRTMGKSGPPGRRAALLHPSECELAMRIEYAPGCSYLVKCERPYWLTQVRAWEDDCELSMRLCDGYVEWIWDPKGQPDAYSRSGCHYTGRAVFTRKELYAMAKSLLATGRGKQQPKGKKPGLGDVGFVKQFPVLHAFLTEETDEDGKTRAVSKVTVFVEQGQVKASLSDPDNESSLYVSCDTFEAVWGALEARLASGEADWRAWAGGKAKRKGKRS